jgi:alpha-tubulin suppressor-like RCC1 family protein
VIKGTGFSTDATVKIGGLDCTVDSQNSGTTVITCVTTIGGSEVKGSADIVVTNSDGTTATLSGGYTYLDYPPLISSAVGSITPTTGPIAGGTTLTILGSNFVNGTSGSTVKLGTSTCTSPFYTSTTQIQCTTPPNAVGPISVTVTNPDGQTATKSGAFTYWGPQPTIASVTPSVGGSNTLITINSSASDFATGATVTVGGSSCSNVTVAGSGTYLTCYTPALTAGAADVIVTNLDGQSSATSVGAYTYRFAFPLISAGDYSTCGVIGGGAYCWGLNTDGQLGSAAGASVKVPTAVTTLTSGVSGIAAGPSHSCGIYNGSAYCWGKGGSGRLGNNDGAYASSTTPVQVDSLTSGVSSVSVGGDGHSCAIVDGSVKCWGLNDKGQLGDSSTTLSNVPVQASGLATGATQVTTGYSHSCAIVNGAAQCWGYNAYGQLGDSSTTDRLVPTAVTGLASNVQQVGAGNSFSCALVSGGVKCWGDNTTGQLGTGNTTQSTSPVSVTGLTAGVQAISVGSAHACALINGTIKCWGANDSNQIGVTGGPGIYKTTPFAVNNISTGAMGVTAGKSHSCAVYNSSFQCWGLNTSGQLGNNSTSTSSVPTSGYGATQGIHGLTAGASHTCVISNGIPKCFGRNDQGQLGNTLGTDQTSATAVAGISSGTKMVSTGNNHTCAIVNGSVLCWGDLTNGKTGQSSGSSLTQSTPAVAANISTSTAGATSISAGYGNSCAILNSGAQCWGDNTYSQLGNASVVAYSNAAVAVTNATNGVSSLSTGGYHACAAVNGSAKCWGRNNVGQIGDATTTSPRNTGTQVTGLTTGVTAVASGLNHSCAIQNGSVQCWGDNTYGQLGSNSNNAYESSPTQVTGITSGATAIAAGAYHTCALVNGAVKCWGRNANGQLGNNDLTYSDTKTPVAVSGLASGVLEIATGDHHTCALHGSTVKCWGLNTYTQLGTDSTATPKSPLPVSVSGI